MPSNNSDVIFTFKTVQTNAIRILFESLKNILSDVNFKADSTGLKLTAVDGTTSAIVNLILYSEKFEEYICENSINIGISLASVFKILKGIKNTDTISFTILKSDPNNMVLPWIIVFITVLDQYLMHVSRTEATLIYKLDVFKGY